MAGEPRERVPGHSDGLREQFVRNLREVAVVRLWIIGLNAPKARCMGCELNALQRNRQNDPAVEPVTLAPALHDGFSLCVRLGKPLAMADDKNVPEKLRKDPLLQGTSWATHLAFFPVPDKTAKQPVEEPDEISTPDYELKLDLLANSVARGLSIDYGNFTVRGTINRLKSLPESGCTPH